jgi:hypothetical protein
MSIDRLLGLAAVLLSVATVTPARAGDTPRLSGDIAVTYGRNWGQHLNVAGLAGELKVNVIPQLSVGARVGGAIGAGVGADESGGSAKAYAGMPLMLKGEVFPLASRTRPFVGLGVGVTRASGAGAVASVEETSAAASAYGVKGMMPTLMPEIGVDLGGFRIALQHSALLGSSGAVQQSLEAGAAGTTASTSRAPGLSGTTLQLGVHLGGPRK